MGIYLNPGNDAFRQAGNSEIYVDKTRMIEQTNQVLCTKQKYICFCRPHRFGKSMAADMLTAYYSWGCDSKDLFSRFRIAGAASFEKHLNRYDVVHIQMASCMKNADSMQNLLQSLSEDITKEIVEAYPDFRMPRYPSLLTVMEHHFDQYKRPFVFIIDDWECIIRSKRFTSDELETYLYFLLVLLKDKSYVALAYLTGVLPVKKLGNQLSLDMFTEVTMTFAAPFAEFTGFTEAEVTELCRKHHCDPEQMKEWCGGYCVDRSAVYHPYAVVNAVLGGKMQHIGIAAEARDAIRECIRMNFRGLREKWKTLLDGERVPINPTKFQNDMSSFCSADDVLTMLIHFGYLTYDFDTKLTWIPNCGSREELVLFIGNNI